MKLLLGLIPLLGLSAASAGSGDWDSVDQAVEGDLAADIAAEADPSVRQALQELADRFLGMDEAERDAMHAAAEGMGWEDPRQYFAYFSAHWGLDDTGVRHQALMKLGEHLSDESNEHRFGETMDTHGLHQAMHDVVDEWEATWIPELPEQFHISELEQYGDGKYTTQNFVYLNNAVKAIVDHYDEEMRDMKAELEELNAQLAAPTELAAPTGPAPTGRCDATQPDLIGGNDSCCTDAAPCDLNEGDCDNDGQCAMDLVCGTDNCAWGDKDDCCMERPTCDATHHDLIAGNDSCCTTDYLCDVDQGDCDNDTQCAGDLVCGTNNCAWGDGDDCCTHAATVTEEAQTPNGAPEEAAQSLEGLTAPEETTGEAAPQEAEDGWWCLWC